MVTGISHPNDLSYYGSNRTLFEAYIGGHYMEQISDSTIWKLLFVLVTLYCLHMLLKHLTPSRGTPH